MRQGQTGYQATGARLGSTANLFILAETCGQAGQAEERLRVIDEAFAAVSRSGELAWEAELWRGKGELLLRRGEREIGRRGDEGKVAPSPDRPFSPPSPEECFLKAIDIAQQRQAKSWELRASTSLARLWQQQGKRAEAHKLLFEVYHWFTEGFDTKDLQEAEALLEELA
jgi:predicted ATPase